jgi:hypothetical protein
VNFLKCEVSTAVKMSMLSFWSVAIFNAENGDSVSPKRWYLPTSTHGVTTQKTNIDNGFTVSFLDQYNFLNAHTTLAVSHKLFYLLQAVFVLALAVVAYAEDKKEEQQAAVSAEKKQDKRGILGLGYGAAPAVSYAAPAVSYAAPAVSYAAPALAAPAIAHGPAISYAAPAVGYAAPAVGYAAPAVSYAAPAIAHAPAAVSHFAMARCSHLPEVACR